MGESSLPRATFVGLVSRRILPLVLAVSSSSLLASEPTPAASPAAASAVTLPAAVRLPPDLARVLTDYETGWRNGDGAALAELFTEDGFVLGNGAPPARGRDAIRSFYKGPGGPLVLRAYAWATQGPVGYIVGGFARRDDQPEIGKFTLTLRQGTDGRWRIFSDMDNGNRPGR